MTDFFPLLSTPLWFREAGRDDDVVVSSRVRLSRNLSSVAFSHLLSESGLHDVRDRVLAAVNAVDPEGTFVRCDFENLSETETEFLAEEGRGARGSDRSRMTSLCRGDGRADILINDEDHLRILSVRGALRLAEAFAEADELDTRLEEFLDYAVSLEWGYLSPVPAVSGTGLGASTLLHLPGTVLGNQLEKIESVVRKSAAEIYPLFPFSDKETDKEKEAFGDLFVLKTRAEMGVSEQESLEKLEETTTSLLHYEREMRNLLFEKKREFLEDQIYRALGILERARSLYFEEAVKLLSLVRMGCSLGTLDGVDKTLVTSLMFLTLPAHIKLRIKEKKLSGGQNGENRERAELIGTLLGNAGK